MPVQVLVHRASGKFGTTLDGESIREHETLADAEAFIREMHESGVLEAMIVDQRYGDNVPLLKPIRLKCVNGSWVKIDGTRLPWNVTPYVPNAEVAAALVAKREEHEALRARLREIRQEAYDLIRTMQPLDT